jgi:hypothetical protein
MPSWLEFAFGILYGFWCVREIKILWKLNTIKKFQRNIGQQITGSLWFLTSIFVLSYALLGR